MIKPTLSVAQRHGYVNFFLGLAFFFSTIVELITVDTYKNICACIGSICFIGVIISYALNQELDDERSEQNLNKAGHTAFRILMIISLCLSIIFRTSFTIDIEHLIKLIIGIGYITYGSMFLYYEKED